MERPKDQHDHEVEPITEHYSEQYDAHYNPKTNEWIEKKCTDTECVYCKDRPERPL